MNQGILIAGKRLREHSRIAHRIVGATILLVGIGVALGLPVAMLPSRLFGLKPVDPLTFSAADLALVLVAIAASRQGAASLWEDAIVLMAHDS